MLPQRRGWACLLILWSSTVILGLGSGVSAAFPVSKNPVRISSEKPADYGEDEKEIALLTLREWGLGSFRLFAELAGARCVACQHISHDMSGFDGADALGPLRCKHNSVYRAQHKDKVCILLTLSVTSRGGIDKPDLRQHLQRMGSLQRASWQTPQSTQRCLWSSKVTQYPRGGLLCTA